MIRLEARDWAVAASTSSRISARWRIVSASVVRIAGRSPPTECWIVMTMTTSRRSVLPIRFTMLVRALSTEAPTSISRRASPNSSDIGGPVFSVTALSDCDTDCPAFIELAMSSIARGRPASNVRRRRPRRLRR